jgi:hypothetical protein
MRILHQAGHNTVWNIASLTEDRCGDGIIFSPVHMTKDKMQQVQADVRSRSLFDPQFYIPDSQKTKLNSYEFFPEKITGGFSTTDFELVAQESASLCLEFQIKNGFESIVVPARYFPDLVFDYIAKQTVFSVEPFLTELDKRKIDKKIFLTLPVTATMTLDKRYREELLNWVTSYPQISGVYYLNQIGETSKQICNPEKLQGHLEFITDLKSADLEVIVGYCNTESILLTLFDVDGVGIGAYENTRGFSIDKFLEEESDKRGPAPRLYFPKLLNWVRYDTAIEIREDHPKLWEKIYTATAYSEQSLTRRPHFMQPEPYKHHFILICRQLAELVRKPLKERAESVRTMIEEAKLLYQEIDTARVMFFDRNCSGDHLPLWNRVVKQVLSNL